MTVQLTVLTDIMSTTIRKMPLETQSENLIRGNQPRLRPSTSENSSRIPDSVPPRPTGRNRFQPQHEAVELWRNRGHWWQHRSTVDWGSGFDSWHGRNFFQISNWTQIFCFSFCDTHLDFGLFYLSVFPVQLVKLRYLTLFPSSSMYKLDKVNKCSFSISVLYLPDTLM